MIPIATDISVRRTPLANYGLILACVFVFLLDQLAEGRGVNTKLAEFMAGGVLNGVEPRLYQFFTYQFLHGGLMHLGGNMLFLWVFGNAVNSRMGNLPYLMFYLAGGVFAATGYLWSNDHSLIGASGAIAAVTTAYLVLFPRSRITILYFWIFIGTFELPSTVLIVFKIILWDNILAPGMSSGSNVAFGAHLAGYAFGIVTVCIMLLLRVMSRDQFDMIALLRRSWQRQSMRNAMSSPNAQAQAQFSRVARPVSLDEITVKMAEATTAGPVNELRAKILEALDRGDRETAAADYEKLLEIDPRQVLGRMQQLDVAGQFYARGRFPQAASAYEKFLSTYPSAPEINHIKLLLGIIYARDLLQYEVAEAHLRESLGQINDDRRREQCMHWLKVANDALRRPEPQA